MKLLPFLTVFLILSSVFTQDPTTAPPTPAPANAAAPASSAPAPAGTEQAVLVNDYKDDRKVKHSLFRERDSLERLSLQPVGIPKPKVDTKSKEDNDFKEPEKIVALRIVDEYRRIFDYLDFMPVDDLLTAEELLEAYKNYDWPKILKATDDTDYCRKVIKKYDKTGKKKINFAEFCEYMEDLWTSYDKDYEEKIRNAYVLARDSFAKLFNWLDRDNDKLITQQDMLFGISRIMLKDADISEIRNVFNEYDKNKTGKINQDQFLLALINGYMKKSFGDVLVKDTFINLDPKAIKEDEIQ